MRLPCGNRFSIRISEKSSKKSLKTAPNVVQIAFTMREASRIRAKKTPQNDLKNNSANTSKQLGHRLKTTHGAALKQLENNSAFAAFSAFSAFQGT